MGNKLVYERQEERDGPGDSVAFFQTLNVKWLSLVADRVKEIKQAPFDLRKVDERIKWNEYFRIFSDIKDKMATENRLQQRNVWHPATLGYSMGPEDEVIELDPEPEPESKSSKVKADDHTDDDPSEISEDEGDDEPDEPAEARAVNAGEDSQKSDESREKESGKEQEEGGGGSPKAAPNASDANSASSATSGSRPTTADTNEGAGESSSSKKKLPTNWDPVYTNPIFFGHNRVKSVDVEKKLNQDKEKIRARENRAIGKAKESRITVIEAMQKTSTAQALSREKKIEDIKRKYTEAKTRHEAEYAKNKKEMIPLAFNAYKVCIVYICIVVCN